MGKLCGGWLGARSNRRRADTLYQEHTRAGVEHAAEYGMVSRLGRYVVVFNVFRMRDGTVDSLEPMVMVRK